MVKASSCGNYSGHRFGFRFSLKTFFALIFHDLALSAIVWNNWKSTQPNGDGNCVALETINYKWGDVGCNETWYIYEICEIGKSTLLMQIKDKPLKLVLPNSHDFSTRTRTRTMS